MKKALCLAMVFVLLIIPFALATVVDSRQNEDLTGIEVIEVVPAPVPPVDPAVDPPVDPTPPGIPDDETPTLPDNNPPRPPVVEIVDPTEEIEQLIEEITPTYELTITHVTIDGTPIGEPETELMEVGQPIDVPTLAVEGYIPIEIEQETMPSRPTEITVIYVPSDFAEELLSINDYDTPLGLGASIMNVGVCVE